MWNDHHKAADARAAINESLTKLGLDYVDLYLIHWPATVQFGDLYIECWDALQQFKAEGLTTSIGVSNFNDSHIAALNGEVPALNQVEIHPRFAQRELRRQMEVRAIAVTSWSPLGRGDSFDDPVILTICEQTDKTPSQVILRWHLQQGLIAIPRSANRAHIAANAEVFDFELSADQMAAIDTLDSPEGRRGQDPITAVF